MKDRMNSSELSAAEKRPVVAPDPSAAPTVPIDKLIDAVRVCVLCGVQKTTLYAWLRQPNSDFPRPIRLGARMTRWSEAQVLQWVQDKIQSGGQS